MANLNKVMLIGTLTRDPELRYTPKGSAIANVGLAINRNWTAEGGEKKEEVTFVDCTLFGRTAENAAQYLKKGRQALFEGRLKLEQWDDKTTGQKRSKLGVVVDNMQFIGGKPESSEPASDSPPVAKNATTDAAPADSDVPF